MDIGAVTEHQEEWGDAGEWVAPPPEPWHPRFWDAEEDKDWSYEECQEYERAWWDDCAAHFATTYQPEQPHEWVAAVTAGKQHFCFAVTAAPQEQETSAADVSHVPIPESESDDELCEAFSGLGASVGTGLGSKILVDSGSVVNTCSEDFDPSTMTSKSGRHWNLETVTGSQLEHHGFKPNVDLRTKDGIDMRVGFEITNAKRPILSVKKGAEHGAMTIFAPDSAGQGKSKIIHDKTAIQQILGILGQIEGLEVEVERGSYIINADVVDKNKQKVRDDVWAAPPSRPMLAPVASEKAIARALSKVQKEDKEKEKREEQHDDREEAVISHKIKTRNSNTAIRTHSQREIRT